MLDTDLEKHLTAIETELKAIKKAQMPPLGLQFIRGIIYGFGYVVGAIIIIAIIGWILNQIGVIPAFAHFVGTLQHYLSTNPSFHT